MCGIAGIIGNGSEIGECGKLAQKMISTLRHRGPDANGVYAWEGGALAHTRLSVIDLLGGAQPMWDLEGRRIIVFNGEIYNYQDINKELSSRGRVMKTRSDTETLVNAIAEWGMEAIGRLRGMFAFCALDTKTGSAIFAVDRVGKKPLYYTRAGGRFLFASELKALLVHPGVERNIDPLALDAYLAYHYVPAPMTIFKNIKKLPAGHVMTLEKSGNLETFRYWSVLDKRERPEQGWAGKSIEEAVRLRLISDVPIGAFLSGGVDSTAIVAAMSKLTSEVKTFTIAFEEADYDESEYARKVAKVYGTEHHEFRVNPDSSGLLPILAWHYDEPFADSSALPTYILSKMTREHVTVALSGDGGDEAFVGYERYLAEDFVKKLSVLPPAVMSFVSNALLAVLPPHPAGVYWRRARKLLTALKNDPSDIYIQLMTLASRPIRENLYSDSYLGMVNMDRAHAYLEEALKLCDKGGGASFIAADFHTYLPGDLLVKTDRASMAVGLEVRCPLLDHVLLEKSYALDFAEKAPRGRLKAILKDTLKNEPLPSGFLGRRKMGFGLPISNWFRTDLAKTTRRLLLSPRALKRGYFKKEAVTGILEAHEHGKADYGAVIWSLVMLETWHRLYMDTLTLNPPDIAIDNLI